MTFYQVNNPKNLQIINPLSNWIFIHNELYTQKELNKLNVSKFIKYIDNYDLKEKKVLSKNVFKKVNISKFKTYWFFGARFECLINNIEKEIGR